ncbi:MAG: hypothetical protein C4562_03720 [Actinobacteria bacterium]|nr:MAG: hypothetical protein C4562_03720 [Actinomycetota bacterium]
MKLGLDVHNYLQDKAIKHEIFLIDEPAKTAKRAAAILGLKLQEIVKSIILKIDDKPFNAIIPGNKKVSLKKVKNLFADAKIKLVNSDEAVDLTGYMLGATPPVAHKASTQTIIDESLMGNEVLYTGSGELNAMLKIRPEDLVEVTEAIVADISE